jgi:hypothetical protein
VTPAPTSKLRIRPWPRRTSGETCPPNEIAESLEKNGIKHLPIVHDGQVVGIVSRANLVQVIATRGSKSVPLSDLTIRDKVIKHLNSQRWVHTSLLNGTVNGGVIDLWGLAASEAERNAIRVAAENTPGVRAVNDRLTVGAIFVKNDRASRVAGKQ